MLLVTIACNNNLRVVWCLMHLRMAHPNKECTGLKKVLKPGMSNREIRSKSWGCNSSCFFFHRVANVRTRRSNKGGTHKQKRYRTDTLLKIKATNIVTTF